MDIEGADDGEIITSDMKAHHMATITGVTQNITRINHKLTKKL